MRTNTPLQRDPLLRIAVILVAGIWTGKVTSERIPAGTWMILTIALLLLVIWLLRIHLKRADPSFNGIPSAVFQTCCIFMAVFALGAWDGTMALKSHRLLPVGKSFEEYAIVISPPVRHGKVERCDLLLADGSSAGKKIRANFLNTPFAVKEGADASRLRVGEGLAVQLTIEQPFVKESRSGNFDYPLWLKIHNFAGTVFLLPQEWKKTTVDLSHLSCYQRTVLVALQMRQKLIRKYANIGITGQSEAVMAAMTLGDKSGISRSTATAYSISGASHILSLSGLHLGIIYGILVFFFGGRNRWWNQIVILLAIWSFTLLAGSGPSVVRSAMMISIYALVSLLNRDKFSLNTWSLALMIMLLDQPLYLFDVGFELSFMAVLGILLGVRLFPVPLKTRVGKRFRDRISRWAWGFVVVSVSAQLWTFPFVIYYFGRFSCYFLLTNLVVVPLATTLLYLVSGGFILYLWPVAARFLFMLADEVSGSLNRTVQWISSCPGASIEGICISQGQVVLIYLALIGISALFFVTLRPQ
ncbi:MAG: ComEC/Rec2 family competence protein [Prevotella sp.]|jgi:competence protein ComEC|nr:ComEC/Rec2 family competence protein [Prevotella sp.]MCI1473416.1 ComEC/Rec2 family competence protein [Prevotella sp.]MCI1517865.1 ComEC/Rec2 family competence protein [Prevotella sp.]MCI1596976.1 ComEC/Rec2 family competence protein [Prevotella sp.]MCI2086805.1 ComEC/Rec2 family competence protein [Prevotella sp.]MCI2124371.1 ComEC/Rec2 family competence protein [Prevotella sp.]